MEQGKFEKIIRARFEKANSKAPAGVWEGITAQLDSQEVSKYYASNKKMKWVAAAAVLLSFLSFALHVDWTFDSGKGNSEISYNALLNPNQGGFGFYQPSINSTISEGHYKIHLPIHYNESRTATPVHQTIVIPHPEENYFINAHANGYVIDRLDPQLIMASIDDKDIETYYVAQYRGNAKNQTQTQRTFWAGVEAGAGNFEPQYNGAGRLNTAANFEAIANTLGQSDFANPSAEASQNAMKEGIRRSFGFDFGMKINEKWTIESGVQYASLNNTSTASVNIVDVFTVNNPLLNSSEIRNPLARQTKIENNLDHSVDLENTMRFTSIPFKAGYFLTDRKVSLRLNAGVTANYLLSSRLSDPSGQLETANSSNLYNEWSFDGLTGIEFGYSLHDHFNLTLEPSYMQS
ncbi:MAG: outer membrane beta-barrel protein, partial [Bacteroidota bacterium]